MDFINSNLSRHIYIDKQFVMFIDQFIIVNNTEVKHFKCVPMPTTITDLFRPLQTPSISNSLIAKEIFLLHKLKCIKKKKKEFVFYLKNITKYISSRIHSSEWENVKASQSLFVTTFASFLLLCQDRYIFGTTDSSYPFYSVTTESLKDTWSRDGLNDLATL